MYAYPAPGQETAEARRLPVLPLAVLAAAPLYLYLACWPIVPPDMRLFLFPWYEHILRNGPVGAFAQPFSNYTPPYLYLLAAASGAQGFLAPANVIKALSVAGTGFLALAAADLLKALGAEPKRGLFIFLLPTVILNAALLGQCDALWAAACLLALAAMIRGNSAVSMLWCGVAIAFKAQAAFAAPLFIGAMAGRQAPGWQWAIPPVVYVALMLPAWLAGWPAADLALIYVRQVEYFSSPGNLTNPWIWASHFARHAAPQFYLVGYAAAAAVAAAVAAFAAGSLRKPKALAALALFSAMALPFVLPKMHERYFFLADALALTLALAAPERRTIAIAAAVQLAALAALLAYIYAWPAPALAAPIIGAWALYAIAELAWREGARLPDRLAAETAPT